MKRIIPFLPNMRCISVAIVFVVIISCVQLFVIEKADNTTLVQIHVLFRHGSRTADGWNGYPTDPYKNETYDPFGVSQITTKGKQETYKLGKFLRKRYDKFLGQYHPEEVYAKTTNFKRTKMTLQVLLASLYPPEGNDTIDPSLNWQPIPFLYDQMNDDVLSVVYLYCASFLKFYYNYVLSNEGQKYIEDYKDLYEELSYFSGFSVKTPRDVTTIYTTLKSQVDWGLALPEWANQFWEEPLKLASAVDYELSTATPQLTRLASGHLLKKILEDTKSKYKNGKLHKTKVYLYSAHEFNIAVMLRALKVYYRHFPPYSSALIFEVHKIADELGFRILYQDHSTTDPLILTIPNCSQICKISDVERLLKDNIATSEDTCFNDYEM